jgi:hypothetical protein
VISIVESSPWLACATGVQTGDGWLPRTFLPIEDPCGAADEPAADGMVYDTDRIMFLTPKLSASFFGEVAARDEVV